MLYCCRGRGTKSGRTKYLDFDTPSLFHTYNIFRLGKGQNFDTPALFLFGEVSLYRPAHLLSIALWPLCSFRLWRILHRGKDFAWLPFG